MIRPFATAIIGLAVALVAIDPADAQRKRAPSASAQDGALASLHEQRREGNRVCMVDHFHNGSSAGQPSRKAAEVAAMRSWAEFTAWEYGDHWGNPAMAGSKSMRCGNDGKSWSCDFDARACRR